jgi:hypothetical protein
LFGSVSYLSGAPLPKFVVDALQSDAAGALSHVEEAAVEESGNFRLHGLASGQAYAIAVRTPVFVCVQAPQLPFWLLFLIVSSGWYVFNEGPPLKAQPRRADSK